MKYPIYIHKDKDSAYGVTVPDLPGCFSAGDTLDEAIESATEAIYFHLEVSIEDGEAVNMNPSSIEDLAKTGEYANGTWAIVSIDVSKLDVKPLRVNISMPKFVLAKIDAHAEKTNETRSGFLARVALKEIAEVH